ncbi:FAD synthetase, chloroplastic-like [Ananas comosus]|uniref:FAD synthase n=1 Tax=Ananas comosus TaxID=4615 RepID=A0A6P5FGC8_ANACO|nr:FAD synthetase, chloroplastic-like [Ananas comosus]
MERGGGALVSSNLRAAAHHASPLLSHRPLLPPRPADPVRRRRRSLSAELRRLLPLFRSHCCLKEKNDLTMQKGFRISNFKVFTSYGSQASLSSEEVNKEKLLIDCGDDQECVLGGIVALGKFDALHIGHRQLAIHASKAGTPFLLSFIGMAEVLGWESRPPIVAKCDRKRVLSSWAPYCGNVAPLEYQVEFSKVRYLTPRQFVERLSKELRISGVVAGENYRFGYKASGDASELVRLCKEYGLSAFIVSPVMDKANRSYNGATTSINSSDKGQVSSTRVRHALAMGDIDYVTELLGRKHRLMLSLNEGCLSMEKRILAPRSCMLNQPPGDGMYENCDFLVNNELVGSCRVAINAENIDIELNDPSFWQENATKDGDIIGIEFG